MQVTPSDSRLPNRGWPKLLALLTLLGAVAAAAAYYGFFNRTSKRDEALQLARSGTFEQAIPALKEYLEQKPNDSEVLQELVGCLTRTQANDAEIEPYCRRWCEVKPNDAEPWRIHFGLLKRLSRQHQAIEAGERLVVLAPFDHLSRMELALLYHEVGRNDDAYRECLQLSETSAVPRDVVQITLGRVELARGNLKEARTIVDGLLKRMPGESVPQILSGLIDLEAGDNLRAIDTFRRIRPHDRRERITVLHSLGTAYSRIGREDEAKKAYQDLARVTEADLFMTDAAQRKGDPRFQMRAVSALFAVEEYADAAMLLEFLHTTQPPTRDTMLLLSKCYAGMGRAEHARQARDRAATLPDPPKTSE